MGGVSAWRGSRVTTARATVTADRSIPTAGIMPAATVRKNVRRVRTARVADGPATVGLSTATCAATDTGNAKMDGGGAPVAAVERGRGTAKAGSAGHTDAIRTTAVRRTLRGVHVAVCARASAF